MLRLRVLTLAGCVLALSTLGAPAQETDLKAFLNKAIEAHGGAKNLDKYKASTSKFKGTIEINGMKGDISAEIFIQQPDKVKNVMKLAIAGQNIDVVTVFNGKKLWVSAMGQTKEIDDEKIVSAARDELQAEAASLTAFLKAPYELNSVGDVKVKGKDAVGIRISRKGHRDISMFFDKKSHLLLKTEMRTINADSGEEVLQEKFMSKYEVKNGVNNPHHIEVHRDGKAFIAVEITDDQPLEKHDDSVFAKP